MIPAIIEDIKEIVAALDPKGYAWAEETKREREMQDHLTRLNIPKLIGIQECQNCRKWHTPKCEERKQCRQCDPNPSDWCCAWKTKKREGT